jgi:hypothetical protein
MRMGICTGVAAQSGKRRATHAFRHWHDLAVTVGSLSEIQKGPRVDAVL